MKNLSIFKTVNEIVKSATQTYAQVFRSGKYTIENTEKQLERAINDFINNERAKAFEDGYKAGVKEGLPSKEDLEEIEIEIMRNRTLKH